MFWSAETPYEQVRARQEELRASAAAAQLHANLRRRTRLAQPAPAGRFSRAARRLHATLARP